MTWPMFLVSAGAGRQKPAFNFLQFKRRVRGFQYGSGNLGNALRRGAVWYPLGAMWMLLGFFLLLTTVATAQQTPTITTTEPKLPVIDDKACPGKGRIVPNWKIERSSPLYSSWRDRRNQTGNLKAGEKVTVLAGVHVTREPDKIQVTKPMPGLNLKPGDIILRYESLGEGSANFWAKGVWYEEGNLWKTIEKDGKGGCGAIDVCDSKVIEDGIHERWVLVKTSTGQTGWALDFKETRGAYWQSSNFASLCAG
jgi:hypothetical protein